MKASDARKATKKSIDANKIKVAKEEEEKILKEESDYWDGYNHGKKYCVDDALIKIKRTSNNGEAKCVIRSTTSDRNAGVSRWIEGKMNGIKNSLEKLDYKVALGQRSSFEHDCDGGGDSYYWMVLTIEW